MTVSWFSPVPFDYNDSRITIDFGLTATTRYFNELIVPKIGSVRTLRAFSYSLAGIKIHQNFDKKETASQLAHGIEALANKVYWLENLESPELNILGINGFKKNPEAWKYKDIIKHYVKSNTMRQSTVSALKNFKLVNGTTYNTFKLEKQGELIADIFLSNKNLEAILIDWINGKNIETSQLRNMTRDKLTKEEIKQFLSFICNKDFDGNSRRMNLWKLFQENKSFDELEDDTHLEDIKMVEAFEKFKAELINLYLEIAENNLSIYYKDVAVSFISLFDSINNLEKCTSFKRQNIKELAELISLIKSNNSNKLIPELLSKEDQLIRIDENGKIQKGNYYRSDRIKALKREIEINELSRLVQLKNLVKESFV